MSGDRLREKLTAQDASVAQASAQFGLGGQLDDPATRQRRLRTSRKRGG